MPQRFIAVVAALAAMAIVAAPAPADTATPAPAPTHPATPAPAPTGPATPAPAPTDPAPPAQRTVGVVSSYADGTLSITLSSGATLTGQVIPRTRVRCRGPVGPANAPGSAEGRPAEPQARGHRIRRVIRRIGRHVRERRCEANQLVTGTAVRRAALVVTPRGSTFALIVLVRNTAG